MQTEHVSTPAFLALQVVKTKVPLLTSHLDEEPKSTTSPRFPRCSALGLLLGSRRAEPQLPSPPTSPQPLSVHGGHCSGLQLCFWPLDTSACIFEIGAGSAHALLQAPWPRRARSSLRRAAAWQRLAEIRSPHSVVGPQTPAKRVAIASGGKQGRQENNQGGERGEILKSGQHQEPVSMATAPYYSCSNCSLF